MTDGDGFITCSQGHRHWGRFGAAGLLVVADVDGLHVLLQHRAAWSHGGDTWGVPGGALNSAETPRQAAARETDEETGLSGLELLDVGPHLADHGTWTYTTFLARAPSLLAVTAQGESADLRWVPVDDVTALPLHPAFARAWPALRALIPR